MRQKIPIPWDFRIMAHTHTIPELERRYHVSRGTIAAWRKKLNIPAFRPPHYGTKKFKGMDSRQEIEMCLNCTKPSCAGNCPAMQSAKRAAGKWAMR